MCLLLQALLLERVLLKQRSILLSKEVSLVSKQCLVLLFLFSLSGPLPVQNVMATRINNTAIRVSWSPLTLPQARGFLTGYTITITPTPISRKRQNNGAVIAMAGPTDTSIVVTGLNPTLQYSVTVAGGTSVGIGETGPPVTPEPLSPVPGTSVTAVPSLVPATSATPVPGTRCAHTNTSAILLLPFSVEPWL